MSKYIRANKSPISSLVDPIAIVLHETFATKFASVCLYVCLYRQIFVNTPHRLTTQFRSQDLTINQHQLLH